MISKIQKAFEIDANYLYKKDEIMYFWHTFKLNMKEK